jgi:hypothetical protein
MGSTYTAVSGTNAAGAAVLLSSIAMFKAAEPAAPVGYATTS